jgi:HSP20 family molecular chaperone IbpA
MPFSLYTNEENHLVHLSLPGVDPQSIDVFIERSQLVIQAKRQTPEGDLLVGEIPANKIERRFSLNSRLDTNSIKASYNKGRLSIAIAKRAKRIDVEVH